MCPSQFKTHCHRWRCGDPSSSLFSFSPRGPVLHRRDVSVSTVFAMGRDALCHRLSESGQGGKSSGKRQVDPDRHHFLSWLYPDTMILEAREKWMSARSDKIVIYAGDRYGEHWNHIASRPKRPLNSIVLDEVIKELLLDDARDFMKAKNGMLNGAFLSGVNIFRMGLLLGLSRLPTFTVLLESSALYT
ncbi:hypothetical protein EDB83DRAFT_277929 [Lactarius deliciosus]|nr:hypothetical protein EDB83DRAFT_277929 [Lactarius deliciosus]